MNKKSKADLKEQMLELLRSSRHEADPPIPTPFGGNANTVNDAPLNNHAHCPPQKSIQIYLEKGNPTKKQIPFPAMRIEYPIPVLQQKLDLL